VSVEKQRNKHHLVIRSSIREALSTRLHYVVLRHRGKLTLTKNTTAQVAFPLHSVPKLTGQAKESDPNVKDKRQRDVSLSGTGDGVRRGWEGVEGWGGCRATPINRLSARVGSIRSRLSAYVATKTLIWLPLRKMIFKKRTIPGCVHGAENLVYAWQDTG
jgi:hypothetical protein